MIDQVVENCKLLQLQNDNEEVAELDNEEIKEI